MFNYLIIPALISFGVSAALCPVLIPFLIRLKVGQTEREELKSHLSKAGTPTMGGLAILAGIIAGSIFFIKDYPRVLPVLLMILGFGVIGFLDDYLKVVLRRSDGLIAWQKMLLQILVTGLFAFYLIKKSGVGLALLIPFGKGLSLQIGWLAVPLLFIVVIGIVNGVNFTDGVDGLASCVTVVASLFLTVSSLILKTGIEPVTAAVFGALLGFLLFNAHPAKVFMGDTGSLALGGFVAASVYLMQMPLYVPLIGFIYMLEVISVMLQVSYFKMTHGKRIFRMAPIHHHFELGGWSETLVVAVFSIVTAVLCLISLMGLTV